MAEKQILVTGARGFIGSHVLRHFSDLPSWGVISSHDEGGRCFELSTPGSVEAFIREAAPDVVVHTAALPSIADCEADRESARRVNVEAVVEIAESCAIVGAHLIHLSTDQVFDGESAPYAEDAPTAPLHFYGETKVMAEKVLLSEFAATVLRPTLVYGNDPAHGRSASESIRLASLQGRKLGLFEDEYRVPVFVGDLVRCIAHFTASPSSGLFHVGGPVRVSRWEFGQAVCRALGLDENCIEPSSLRACGLEGARPKDLTLSCARLARTMPWNPLTPEEALAPDSQA